MKRLKQMCVIIVGAGVVAFAIGALLSALGLSVQLARYIGLFVYVFLTTSGWAFLTLRGQNR